MKRKNQLLMILPFVLVLSACGGTTPSNVVSSSEEAPISSEPVQESSEEVSAPASISSESSSAVVNDGVLKEIALKEGAKTTLSVTDKIGTVSLFELKANKGKTLKSADKKVIITSDNPEVLAVDKTTKVVSTFVTALKPGNVKLTVQSAVQEDVKLVIDITVVDSVFDRQAVGFDATLWDNCDLSHEIDEEDPYISTVAEEGVNHQFYFRDSYVNKCYVESEFTFYSEKDGNAHLPKIGFAFSTNDINDTDLPSTSFIYFDTDSRNGNTTFYNVGYNERASGIWGWDVGGHALAKHFTFYRYSDGIHVGDTFKMGVVKDGYYYHIYFNDVYVKSIETTKEGFSTDKTYSEAAPTICGLFDFKAEVKYSNYFFTTDADIIASKIPLAPDFTDINGNSTRD